MSDPIQTAKDNARNALRVIDAAGAQMQAAIDTIKVNGGASDGLLASILATHEAVADMARGFLEIVVGKP